MLSAAQLHEMDRIEIDKIDRNTLVDVKTVGIDTSLPIEKRMLRYLEQIKNPYCFFSGKTVVKIRFSDMEKTLDEAVKDHYLGLKNL